MQQADAVTRTTQETEPTAVRIRAQRTVTYFFQTGAWPDSSSTETGLKIPYEVAFNGTVQRRVEGWPKRIVGRTRFSIRAPEGTEVSLYLNTDSLPGGRQFPVYSVTPQHNDIYVKVTERRGIQAARPVVTLDRSAVDKTTGAMTDYYSALLHGDTWASISRKYTEQEAADLIPADCDSGIRSAIMSVYRVLTQPTVIVNCATPQDRTITITFSDADNARSNIRNFDNLSDGLTRIHPIGLFALMDAARLAGVETLNITSCWRPLLGSIAHRAGIGLDVNRIGDATDSIRLNRGELIGSGPDLPWVSERERQLFRASRQSAEARRRWIAEMEANRPALFAAFRQQLQDSPHVQQLFDPWYIDSNTHDAAAPTPNDMAPGNANTHKDHLHITVNAPGIL
ncbi:hypothetical protein GOY17_07305 [Lysobacter soli]|uniref:hypothetical protein n=1 Tax=Lysobacter soli TaxID=453783 RepID=UPI0012ED5667|nr:hypothetical protein [Lysobacter soli]QGW64740.1 hypothetical protein GOY17_07305 [Lysobacter soli]